MQYKRFSQAIDKRETKHIGAQARVIRLAISDKKTWNSFMRSIEANEQTESVGTERDLEEMGMGKKR